MKTLYLLRHAKSSSENPGCKDFDRPLSKRGLNDVPVMASRFKERKFSVQLMISSSAKRAQTTASLMAKNIGFSIANSPLFKTAIAGEDPNWGRIIMAIGKAYVNLNLNKLAINFGNIKVIEKGQLFSNYEEIEVAEYMRGEKVDLTIDLNIGNKSFTAYTMDLTKKYIEINADYRS